MSTFQPFRFLNAGLAALSGSLLTASAGADPLGRWEASATLLNGGQVFGMAYGAGRYIAVAQRAINLSTNGADWTVSAVRGGNAATYAGGLFVVVGGGDRVAMSADGITWMPWSHGGDYSFTSVCYGKGRYAAGGVPSTGVGIDFAVGDYGGTWKTSRFPADLSGGGLTGIACGRGAYVYVSGQPGLWSTDGLNWHPADVPTNAHLWGVAFGKARFVGPSTDGAIYASATGRGFSLAGRLPVSGSDLTVTRVSYGNGAFVVVGYGGFVATSTDGTNWVKRQSGTTDNLFALAFGGGRFVATGGNKVIGSGITPPTTTVPRIRAEESLRLEDGTMLLTVEAPYGREVTVEASPDLLTWTPIATDPCDRGEFEVYDHDAQNLFHRFYRARQAAP